MLNPENNIEWIKNFKNEASVDQSFELFNNISLWDYDEAVEHLWNKFSNMYYIACSPFAIDKWKDNAEIYRILERYAHTAEWRTFEILIGEYNEESMNEMIARTEELKKELEGLDIQFEDPKKYMFIVWFYWWSSWRNIQYIIEKFKKIFPDRIKTITPDDLK